MKWFFILMLFNQNTPVQDHLYLIQEPKFSTPQECLRFVEVNQPLLRDLGAEKFPTQYVENIYCLTQDALDSFITDNPGKSI